MNVAPMVLDEIEVVEKSLSVEEYNLLRDIMDLTSQLKRAPTTFEILKTLKVEAMYLGFFFRKIKGGWKGLVDYLNKNMEVDVCA